MEGFPITGVVTDENGCFGVKAVPGSILVVSGLIESKEIAADVNTFMTINTKRIDFTGGVVVVTIAGQVSVNKIDKNIVDVPEKKISIKNVSADPVTVYPNPVSPGSSISVEWKQTEEGYYRFQLINPAGQSVHQKEIWIDMDAKLLNLDMPLLPAGSYFLVLVNKKTGKKFTERVMLQ